jgi:hypothetical protein
MSDLTTQITSDAAKSQSTTADGVSVSRRSLNELIEADKYLAAKDATAPANMAATIRGMMFKMVPPGGAR